MKPSRAMIPGEILCSVIGLELAYFGGIYTGWLHSVLAQRGGNFVWFVTLGVPAAMSLFLGVREMVFWQHWNFPHRMATARWRARSILLQGLCWLYAVYFCFGEGIMLIGWLGVSCFAFCVWSYLENRRTCREIRYATTAPSH